jgi:urease accessory protein UreF
MENTVRSQIYRICFVYFSLIALVVWQTHFVVVGIESNPYLNCLIIAVFLFGSLKGILSITSMSNEKLALDALREAYDDAVMRRDEQARDPLWRHHRCFEPAVVFQPPKLLGPIYDLAMDEIRRARTVRLSVETMSSLLHAVDRKIITERSLLAYLTGLSIFLGLIGTFIGLMEMVGSVGGIIGGLARSDNASADSIKQLIRDLEAPLIGMATGFSSSLFGLFGSLILGLVARFGAQASNAIRDELEGWLAQMARIESEREVEHGALPVDRNDMARFGGAAVAVMSGVRRTNQTLARAADAIRLLATRQTEQSEVIFQVCSQLETVAQQHSELRDALVRTSSAQAEVGMLRQEVQRGMQTVGDRLDAGLARVGGAMREAQDGMQDALDQASARHLEAIRLSHEVARGVDERTRVIEGQLVMDRDRHRQTLQMLDDVLSAQRDHHEAGLRDVSQGFVRLEATVGQAVAQMETRIGQQGGQLTSLQNGLAGLGDALNVVGGRVDQTVGQLTAAVDQRMATQGDTLQRVAHHQAELGRILSLLSRKMDKDTAELGAGLQQTLGEGLSHVVTAVERSQGRLAEVLQDVSRQQESVAKALESAAPSRDVGEDLRELGQSMRRALSEGFEGLGETVAHQIGTLAGAHVGPPPNLSPSDLDEVVDAQAQAQRSAPTVDPFVMELRRKAAQVLNSRRAG